MIRFTILALLTHTLAGQTESFESQSRGVIAGEISGKFGRFEANQSAEVSLRRAKTGVQALRILGGVDRRVVLRLNEMSPAASVSFWAERWTRRAPFDLRVDARVGGEWKNVSRDKGKAIVVGGYRGHVEFEVDAPFDALRWTLTSHKDGGMLLDDLAIREPRPMRIVTVTAEQPVLPVLFGIDKNPVLRVHIETDGNLEPIEVTAIDWTMEGHSVVSSVLLLHGTVDRFDENALEDDRHRVLLGRSTEKIKQLQTKCSRVLRPGSNYFWLCVRLRETAMLDEFVDAACAKVRLAGGTTLEPKVTDPEGRARMGVAVRRARDDGVHTYRIPGITTTARGTLVAVYDVRRRSGGDLPGDIDVGMSRSTDKGRTWEPMRVIMDMGDDPKWRYDGVGDPAILYDEKKHVLWVAATWSHGNRSWSGSGPGLEPHETGQLLLVKSEDDGRTWSKPINITKQVKDPAWCFVLQGPGRGITMADGTLVFGAQYQDPPDKKRMPYSTIMFSRDHGKTWRIGKGARPNTTECQPVEVSPGVIMLNMRDNRRGSRSVLVTDDFGATWRAHPTHRRALVEPTCNAGLLRIRDGKDGAWLAFVNPAVASPPRRQMTIKLSTDGGRTWPTSQQILLDAGRSAGYPSLTMVDTSTIGIFYEGSRAQMTFQRVRVDELLGK